MSAEQDKQNEEMKQARADCQMYLTLSQELLKFISKPEPDIDEFIELGRQRGVLVERMKALPALEAYRRTPECQALAEKIRPLDMQIIYKAKAWLNKSKRQNAAVHAYDLQGINPLGNILNKKY